MNFDDMKSAWKNDSGNGLSVPKNIEQLKSAGTPVDKMRKMMKMEFIVQLLAIIFCAFVPQLFSFKPGLYLPYYLLYVVFAIICVYYLFKFYLFNKRLDSLTLSSKDNLYELYYDIKLNIEVYKAWSYSLSPFMIFFGLIVILNKGGYKMSALIIAGSFNWQFIAVMIAASALSVVFVVFSTEHWVKSHYGKYAQQVKSILNELAED